MKKLLAILLALCMVFSLVGCAEKQANNDENKEEEKKVYKIAMVSNTVGTDQFLLQAYNQLQESAQEHGFEFSLVECTDVAAYTEKSKQLCDEGYNLLVGVGWNAAAPLAELAEDYADVEFAVIDTVANSDRMMSINFNTVDGCYVMGAMIATAFENDTLFGYIGNFEQQSNFEYEYGFRMGVKSVTPEAKFIHTYTSDYSDTSKSYNAAVQLAAAGCNFIMGSVANSANAGIYQYALERANNGETPIYTSGLSVDQTTSENPYIVSGLTKNTAIPMKTIIEDFLEDEKVTAGVTTLGVTEGAFCVVGVNFEANYRNTDIITDAAIEAGKAAAQDIAEGKVVLQVPAMADFDFEE